ERGHRVGLVGRPVGEVGQAHAAEPLGRDREAVTERAGGKGHDRDATTWSALEVKDPARPKRCRRVAVGYVLVKTRGFGWHLPPLRTGTQPPHRFGDGGSKPCPRLPAPALAGVRPGPGRDRGHRPTPA